MSKTENPILRLYDGFVKAVSSLQSPFLLLVRVYWGWQLSQNGWAKLHNLAHVTDFFSSLGLPAPHATAAFVSSFEFVCGILLALGLLTRIAALGLTIDMFTAYWTADHVALLSFVSDPDKFQDFIGSPAGSRRAENAARRFRFVLGLMAVESHNGIWTAARCEEVGVVRDSPGISARRSSRL
jgi:putative oxidoreductase